MSLEDSPSPKPIDSREVAGSSESVAALDPVESSKAETVDPNLTEDAALALMKRSDLSGEILEQISKHGSLTKSRKVKLALVTHPMTPRHVSLPIVRHLYTFDLMKVALTPVVPADVKVAADESLIARLEKLTLGEKLSLAKRASGRVAGALLNDPDSRVIDAALENLRLTEASIVRALTGRDVTTELVQKIWEHPKWSLRHEVRNAVLQNGNTPLSKALEFARGMPVEQARQIIEGSQRSEYEKHSLLEELGRDSRD